MPDSVNMVSPTGETASVPIDKVAGFGSQGWKVETAGQAAEAVGGDVRTAGMGGVVGSGLALAGGLARGATLGLSDVVARQVGLGDTLAGAQEAHPTISTGSQLVGAVAPAFAAPASLLAKTPAGLASRAALSVTRVGEGAGTVARLGYAGAGAALEGGLQNAGSYVSETALADKALAADAFAAAMGHGALWGGVAGVGLAASERALVAARRLFPKSEVTREAVQVAEDEAQHGIASAVDDGAAVQQTARAKLQELRDQKAAMDVTLRQRLDEVKVQRAKDLAAVDVKAREAAAAGRAGKPPRKTRRAMAGEEPVPAAEGVPAYPPNEDAIYSVRAGDLRTAEQDGAGFDPAKVERYKAARAKGDAPYLDEPISVTQRADGSLKIDQGRHRLASASDDQVIKARFGKAYEPSPSELAASKAYDAALARGATSEELDAILRDGAKSKIAAEDAAAPAARKSWREFTTGKMGPYMRSEGSHAAAMSRLSREWKAYQAGEAGIGASESDLMPALAGTKSKLDAGEALGGMGARAAKPARAIDDAMNDVAAVGDPAHARLVTAERAYDEAHDQLQAWLAKYPRSKVKGVTAAEDFTAKYGGGRTTVGRVRDYSSGPVGRFQGGAMERVSSLSGTAEEQAAWMARKQLEETFRPSLAERILEGDPVPRYAANIQGGRAMTAAEILDTSNLQLAERGLQPLDDRIADALRAKVPDFAGDLNEAAQVISTAERAHAEMVDAIEAVAPGTVPPSSAARAADYKAAVTSKESQVATATADATHELGKAADVISLGGAPVKAPGATRGVLKWLSDAGTAVEIMNALGIHTFDPGNIPVVGPLLSKFLRARIGAKIFLRMRGKIPETAETVIASKAAATRQRVIDAVDRMTETGARAAGKAIVPGAAVSAALGHTLFAAAGEKPRATPKATPLEQFHARAAEVVASQAPGAIRDAVRARVGATGELFDHIVSAKERQLSFLFSKLPQPQGPTVAGTPPWVPSRSQITSFARYVHGSEDPAGVIEHAASGGAVTVEEVEAVAACYPELYAAAQRQLIERVARPEAQLSYKRRVQLSTLFKVPLDRSTEPAYAQWLQQSYQPSPTAQPPQAAMGTPTIQGPVDLGARTSPALDARAGG